MRSALKSIIRTIAILCVSPLLLTHAVLSWWGTPDSSLETHTQILSVLPGITGSYLRVAFLRFALEDCDPSAMIGFGTLFSKVSARIGAHVYIGPRCMLGWVTLEQDVLLGPSVQIPSGPNIHGIARLDVPIRNQPGDPRRVTVGQDSWIGAGTIVLADVGRQSVIGAGSVVTRPIDDLVIAAGAPARMIRARETGGNSQDSATGHPA